MVDATPHTLSSQPMTSQDAQTTQAVEDSRVWELALRVIDLARGLIVSDNPFLSSAIGLLASESARLDDPFACDGRTLFVDADKVLARFSHTREAPVSDLAHVLLHCVLLHPFVGTSVDGASWDLAADIVAELLASDIVGARSGERGTSIDAVRKQLADDMGGSITTERLYRLLRDGAYETERRQWGRLFHVDDHSLWPSAKQGQSSSAAEDPAGQQGGDGMAASGRLSATRDGTQGEAPTRKEDASAGEQTQGPDSLNDDQRDKQTDESGRSDETGSEENGGHETLSPSPSQTTRPSELSETQRRQAEQAWNRAAKSIRVNLETISRSRGAGLGGLVRELEVGTHERVDYRSFLRQFAVEHENMRLSDDEFDYIFYTYGLELYRDMPLIEPLEYRHEKRIRDFVIVIDTSSSVSAKVVQEFVNTTFDVLSSEGGFFSQTNIHIIQADARVQSDAKICSLADLDRWRRNIKLYGFGGTDFRPAFTYVQQLRQQGEFDDLQGLLYFTDGWGIYPDRMPPYKCAFVFYDEDHRPELVPPWAIQVVLHPGQYESLSVY